MSRCVPVLLAVLVLALPGAAAASRAGGWRAPLDGTRTGAFTYDPGAPFAAGARRGLDLAAPPGTPVRAACAGVVTWVGRTPARAGVGVAVRCGGFVATHLGLGSAGVRRGTAVGAGTRLGTLGAAGVLRLGARRAGSRWGYVDPEALLGGGGPGAGPAPVAAPRPPAWRPRARSQHWRPAGGAGAGAGAGVLGYAALGLLAASVVWHRCPSTSRRRSTTSTRLRTWGTPTRRSRPT